MFQFSNHQVRPDYIPDCPLSSIPIVTLGPFPIKPIGSLNMIGGSWAVGVIEKRDRSDERSGILEQTLEFFVRKGENWVFVVS